MLWPVRLIGDLVVGHYLIVLVNGTILIEVEFQSREKERISIATEMIMD